MSNMTPDKYKSIYDDPSLIYPFEEANLLWNYEERKRFITFCRRSGLDFRDWMWRAGKQAANNGRRAYADYIQNWHGMWASVYVKLLEDFMTVERILEMSTEKKRPCFSFQELTNAKSQI